MRRAKRSCGLLFLFFLLLLPGTVVFAGEETGEQSEVKRLEEELDYGELDDFLEENSYREKVRFSDVVDAFLEVGGTSVDLELVGQWAIDLLFYEVEQNRRILLEILILVMAFSMLYHFVGILEKPHVAEISFVLCYCVLAVLLLKSVVVMNDVVKDALEKSVGFIRAFVPTYCMTMAFSSNVGSSMVFYQLSFLLIYLIQFVFQTVLVAVIHIYVLMELLGHFFEDEKFEGIAELLSNFVRWSLKLAWGLVLGLSVVQNLIAPVKDRLTGGVVQKAVAVIPGVGNAFNGITEMMIGSGILLKNCVGAAGAVLLIIVCATPMIQVGCMALFYRIAGALVQPVADKRIYECLKGVANGGELYFKTIGASVLLFVLMLALTTAATGSGAF